jgi:DNA replication protein DnaC
MTSSEPTTTAQTSDASSLSLEQVMRSLELNHAASLLAEYSQKAVTRGEPPTSLVDKLMREQLRFHLEHRAQLALRRSGIFPLSSFSTYDFDYPKSIDRELCFRASTLEFLKDKSNIVFVGPSGVGKTHLANSIGQLACLQGFRVKFVVAADLVNSLVTAQTKNGLARALATWGSYDLLLIDELGYLSFDSRGADLLYQVFNRRYQRGSTIVTTNLPFKDWGKLFTNAAAASAIADRLVHKGLLIRITGKSRRSDQELTD